jgi:hypothetical protein
VSRIPKFLARNNKTFMSDFCLSTTGMAADFLREAPESLPATPGPFGQGSYFAWGRDETGAISFCAIRRSIFEWMHINARNAVGTERCAD